MLSKVPDIWFVEPECGAVYKRWKLRVGSDSCFSSKTEDCACLKQPAVFNFSTNRISIIILDILYRAQRRQDLKNCALLSMGLDLYAAQRH